MPTQPPMGCRCMSARVLSFVFCCVRSQDADHHAPEGGAGVAEPNVTRPGTRVRQPSACGLAGVADFWVTGSISA